MVSSEKVVLFLAFACFVAAVVPGIWYLMWREDFDGMRSAATYRRELPHRERLTPWQFHARYYAASGIAEDLVVRFLRFVALYWDVPVDCVRPGDDYTLIAGGGDADGFLAALEQEFGIEVTPADCKRLDGSFDTLVRYLASRGVNAPEEVEE